MRDIAVAENVSTAFFVGRQPIFDRQKNVFGYELLYRSGEKQNAYACADGDVATRTVMHGSLNVVGLQELTGNKRALVNVTRNVLLNEEYVVLPPAGSVVELLETVEPDAEVLEACRKLKDAGYLLALDDFAFAPQYRPLMNYADILKIDFLATDPIQRRRLAQEYGGRMLLLAEKVETQEVMAEAVGLGYSYFQGYFFCKPQIVSQREIPPFKRNCLRFIQEVNAPEISYTRLEEVVKHDAALATRLLRYLNSAAIGLVHRVTSIRQALALLGEKPLRKWASLIAMAELGRDKPTELMVTALVRARFCELTAPHVGLRDRSLDCFIMGLLSAVDALTDRPMSETIAQIPLPADVTAALVGEDNPLGPVYAMALAFERGRNQRIDIVLAKTGLSFETASSLYRQAIAWADQSMVS